MCTRRMSSSSSSPCSRESDFAPSVNGRPVLQPTCNRVSTPHPLERQSSIKKIQSSPKTPPTPPPPPPPRASPTSSPKLRSPRPPAVKRGSETNILNSSSDKITLPPPNNNNNNNNNTSRGLTRSVSALAGRKKSKKVGTSNNSNTYSNVDHHPPTTLAGIEPSCLKFRYSSSLITEAPGSIAAVRREQVAFQHAQRKMKIAHYGRSKSAKSISVSVVEQPHRASNLNTVLEKRCSFITPNSDPLLVAYHDEEWGVPVHNDKLLFELLVLSGAQVGLDWNSILRKRQDFRDAFSGFDAKIAANLTEKQMGAISARYAIDMSRVRGVVDNANRVLEIQKEFGSFDKYIWGFVNGEPASPRYKFAHKIPVKTSKSESISKDMVRRGFRTVGPTTVHSFMQAAGLTNDHLITCYRHLECTALASISRRRTTTTTTTTTTVNPPPTEADD